MEDIRIALAQITCPVGELAANLEKHRQYTRRAAQAGAKLVCFSEGSLTGYPAGEGVPHELAQPLNGELCQSDVVRELNNTPANFPGTRFSPVQ
jgi:predicted amidohydrolase